MFERIRKGALGMLKNKNATLAQLVEHSFRKAGVPGPIPGGGSKEIWYGKRFVALDKKRRV